LGRRRRSMEDREKQNLLRGYKIEIYKGEQRGGTKPKMTRTEGAEESAPP